MELRYAACTWKFLGMGVGTNTNIRCSYPPPPWAVPDPMILQTFFPCHFSSPGFGVEILGPACWSSPETRNSVVLSLRGGQTSLPKSRKGMVMRQFQTAASSPTLINKDLENVSPKDPDFLEQATPSLEYDRVLWRCWTHSGAKSVSRSQELYNQYWMYGICVWLFLTVLQGLDAMSPHAYATNS